MGQIVRRKIHQRIQIGDSIVTINDIGRREVTLHIHAPSGVPVKWLDAEPKPMRTSHTARRRFMPDPAVVPIVESAIIKKDAPPAP